MTAVDQRLLAELARFHAAKMRAATQLAFYEQDHQAGRIKLAEGQAVAALEAWKRLSALATPVYRRDLVFGIAKDSPRSKLGHHHTGNWQDRLPEVEADVTYLRELRAKVEAGGELPEVKPWPGEEVVERVAVEVPRGIEVKWQPDGGAEVQVIVSAGGPLQRAILHHRPLDQTRDWNTTKMQSTDGRVYRAAIPAEQIDPRFEWQCYLELLGAHSGTCWPHWENAPPYVVLRPPTRER
jgi:hypothetical protein